MHTYVRLSVDPSNLVVLLHNLLQKLTGLESLRLKVKTVLQLPPLVQRLKRQLDILQVVLLPADQDVQDTVLLFICQRHKKESGQQSVRGKSMILPPADGA